MDILLEKGDDSDKIRRQNLMDMFKEEFKDEFYLIEKKPPEPVAEIKPKKSKDSEAGTADPEEDEDESDEEKVDTLENFEAFIYALGSWKKPLWDMISGHEFQALY
jgi:hypothetical protein